MRRGRIYFFLNKENVTKKSDIHFASTAFCITRHNFNIWVWLLCQVLRPPRPQYRNHINKLGQVRWRVTESVTGALWEGLVQPGEETILGYLRATPVPMRDVLQWQSQASVGASWWNAWDTKGICWNKKDAEWLQGKAFCLQTIEQATKDFESLITTPR